MCNSLNEQEFYINKENIFYRYYGETQKELRIQKIKCKGLVLGVNLPPITHHFHYCRSYIIYLPNIEKQSKSNYNDINESEILDNIKKKAKEYIYNTKIIKFEDIPEEYRKAFIKQLDNSEINTRKAIIKEMKKTDYILTSEPKSTYNDFTNTLKININKTRSTLAHELFHKIDKKHKISTTKEIKQCLKNDFENIKLDKTSIINQIKQIDSNAFIYNSKGKIVFNEKYRGLSDIINGYSKGMIKLGYGHSEEYWNKKNKLYKETFAQFGRMYYENDNKVIKTLEVILPKTKKYIDNSLKKVVKKHV